MRYSQGNSKSSQDAPNAPYKTTDVLLLTFTMDDGSCTKDNVGRLQGPCLALGKTPPTICRWGADRMELCIGYRIRP